MENDDKILCAIDNIKYSGLSTMEIGYGYWSIVFTLENIYFIKLGSYFSSFWSLPVAVYAEIVFNNKLKQTTDDVNSYLQIAKKYYKVSVKDKNQISLSDTLLGKFVVFKQSNGKTIKIRLDKNQYEVIIPLFTAWGESDN